MAISGDYRDVVSVIRALYDGTSNAMQVRMNCFCGSSARRNLWGIRLRSALVAASSLATKFGQHEGPRSKFLGKFWGLSAWMLEMIMLLSLVLRNSADLAIVGALLVVNAVLGFAQERLPGGAGYVKHYDGYSFLLDDLVLKHNLLICEAIGNDPQVFRERAQH